MRLLLDVQKTFNSLQRALSPDSKAYFILDGLDECNDAERELLIQQLQELQKVFSLLLCVSLRLGPRNPIYLSPRPFTNALTSSIRDDNPEIESFIEVDLESRIESQKVVIGHPALVLEIQDALLRGSQGLFLWVSLQIEIFPRTFQKRFPAFFGDARNSESRIKDWYWSSSR